MKAYELAYLIGKYVQIERPATDLEKENYDLTTYGGSGIVQTVWDTPVGVEVCFDYGMSVMIYNQFEDTTRFCIAPNEDWDGESYEKIWGSFNG